MKFERRISSLREYYAEMQLILSKEEILVVAVIFAIIYEIHLVMALEVFIVILISWAWCWGLKMMTKSR